MQNSLPEQQLELTVSWEDVWMRSSTQEVSDMVHLLHGPDPLMSYSKSYLLENRQRGRV
jgi:hypothetical protein